MSIINVMEDELELRDGDSDSSFRESLAKTGGTIGENLATLSQQERHLVSRIEMIKRQIADYKQREPKLAEYAKKILTEKQKIDEEKKKYSEELEMEQAKLESEIARLANSIRRLNEKSQSVRAENDALSNTKNAFSLKIEDMSALETDFVNETIEIDARIDFYNQEMKKSTRMMPDASQMMSVKQSIVDINKKQEEVETLCIEFDNKDAMVQNELQSIQMEQKQLEARKETEVHIARLEIDRLKRKLTRAREEFELEYQSKENQKIMKEQLIDAIDAHEANIKSAESSTTNTESCMNSHVEEITAKEAMIKEVQEELAELSSTLEFIKKCQNIEEYNRRCAIDETKSERIATLRKSGELMLQCKLMKKTCKERHKMLAKLSQKIETAIHIEKLLEKGERVAERNEMNEHPAEIEALVAQLNMLNQHIEVASKYADVLDHHRFHDLTPSVATAEIPNEVNQRLKEKLKKLRHINVTLTSRIDKYLQHKVASEPASLLHKCSLFPHVVKESTLCVHIPQETKDLEERVQEKKAQVQRKRDSLAAKKLRLASVCDNIYPYADAECHNHCHQCSRFGIIPCEISLLDGEKLLQKLRNEAEVWKYSRFMPTTLLHTWNNQLEHILRDCLKPQYQMNV